MSRVTRLVRKHYRLMAVLLFLLISFLLFHLTGLRDNLTLDYLRESLQQHYLIGGTIFVALFCLGNLIQIPGLLFLAAAVLTLGKLEGGLLTYVAANVSCLATFVLIRIIGGDTLRQIDTPFTMRIFQHLDDRPILSIFALRLILQTAPPLNFSLALARIRVRNYALGTALGLPIPIAFYCFAFDFVFVELL